MIDFIFTVLLVIMCALPVGSTAYDVGQNDLCKKQFAGEMKDGKCVKVTREEIK